MTTAVNVLVTVTEPDLLIAGESAVAPFVVASILLYRYTTEANARTDTSAALVTTFTLVPSTTAAADPDVSGPYRFGYYDASQAISSWYRYRFADATLASLSNLSEPWEADNRPSWALRDILFEVGQDMGGTVLKGTATAGSTTTVTCAALFKSTLRDAYYFEGWCLTVSQDAGGAGAAPEGEFALIASVDTATGIATLERALTQAPANGDIVLVSSLMDVDEMIRVFNRAREEMRFNVEVDVALSAQEDRYPAPYGVKSDLDIVQAYGMRAFANSNREDLFEIDVRVVGDGQRYWLEIGDTPGVTNVARLTLLRNYRDLEGNLALMSDTTACPIEWMRPAFAYACAEFLSELDPGEPQYQALLTKFTEKARAATARYGAKVTRPIKKGAGRRVLPGPIEVP